VSDRAADERGSAVSFSLRRSTPGRFGPKPATTKIEFGASHRVVETTLERTFAQQRCRVVPERLRECVAHISARDADIGEHASIRARQNAGLTAVPARTRQFFEPVGQERQEGSERPYQGAATERQNRVIGAHFSLHSVSQYGPKFALGAAQNHPKPPPDSLWNSPNIALRGLISETNVFNLTDQE
jgi:hypothetical protein